MQYCTTPSEIALFSTKTQIEKGSIPKTHPTLFYNIPISLFLSRNLMAVGNTPYSIG